MAFNKISAPDPRTISETPCARSEPSREVAALAQRLFSFYPPPDVGDPRMLLSAAIAMMQMFPIEVVRGVCDPISGLPATNKFAPNLAEIRHALEVLDAPRKRREERERAAHMQLNERKQLVITDRRERKTYEQLQAECAAVGLFIGQGRNGLKAMKAEDIREKYGVTKEQWDAIPNAKL